MARPRRLATRWVCGLVAMGSLMMVLWMSGFCGCVEAVGFDLELIWCRERGAVSR